MKFFKVIIIALIIFSVSFSMKIDQNNGLYRGKL